MTNNIQEARNTIAAALKNKRIELGISQTDLSRLTGITRRSIYNIEHGKHQVYLECLLTLCSALKIEPQEIFLKIANKM